MLMRPYRDNIGFWNGAKNYRGWLIVPCLGIPNQNGSEKRGLGLSVLLQASAGACVGCGGIQEIIRGRGEEDSNQYFYSINKRANRWLINWFKISPGIFDFVRESKGFWGSIDNSPRVSGFQWNYFLINFWSHDQWSRVDFLDILVIFWRMVDRETSKKLIERRIRGFYLGNAIWQTVTSRTRDRYAAANGEPPQHSKRPRPNCGGKGGGGATPGEGRDRNGFLTRRDNPLIQKRKLLFKPKYKWTTWNTPLDTICK